MDRFLDIIVSLLQDACEDTQQVSMSLDVIIFFYCFYVAYYPHVRLDYVCDVSYDNGLEVRKN